MGRISTLALTLLASAAPAVGQQFKAGDVVIEKPWARATPKGAEVGAGYFVVRNNGVAPERLTGGSADFAAVEIHEMKMEGGIMQMRELKGGVEIPAHGSITLAPGGDHLMFNHLAHPMTKGEMVKATLEFEHAGPIEVAFPVLPIGASGPAAAKGADVSGTKQ